MSALNDLSESTKHALDLASATAAVAVGTAAAITLNQAALMMTILAAACSVIWFCIRLYDRIRYGPGRNA